MSTSSVPGLALVGVGNWGKNHLRNFAALPDCRVAAVCDRDPVVIERVKQQHPDAFVTEDFDAVLARPDVDAVAVTSSAVTHAPLGIQALKSGRDVFVEKPMALSAADAEEMVQTAEAHKRVLMVGHLLLFHPAVELLKSLVEEGQLGDVHYVNSRRVNLGQIRSDENALWSFAPHDLSIIGEMLPDAPVSVSARGGAYIQSEIEDVVFLNVKYPQDRMAHVHVSWLDPHKIRETIVAGSKKMVVFDDMQPSEKVRIYDKGIDHQDFVSYDQAPTLRFGDILVPRLRMTEPLKVECQHFLDCVRERKRPRTDGESGLTVVRILEAGQQSLKRNGEPVAL